MPCSPDDAEIAELTAAMSDPEYFKRPANDIAANSERMNALNEQLAEAYSRWEELEGC